MKPSLLALFLPHCASLFQVGYTSSNRQKYNFGGHGILPMSHDMTKHGIIFVLVAASGEELPCEENGDSTSNLQNRTLRWNDVVDSVFALT